MAKFNFDQIIERKGTQALKHDALKDRFGHSDLIPLWVADMDFLSPPQISEAIAEKAKHGIFGYTSPSDDYYGSIIDWVKTYHDWKIEQNWISYVPGIVKAIAFVIDCFTEEGDKIIIQEPVYKPFRHIPELHNRVIINNGLVLENGQYKMDFEDLKQKITSDCKIFILCNPHNPAGRAWTKEELTELADICYERGVLVISDEIHADLVYGNKKHIPFASVSSKAAQNSITFMAPSKTFNIAGIVSSYAIVSDDVLRHKFYTYLEKSELTSGNIFAYLATEVAYRQGHEWLQEVKEYLWQNILFVDNYLKKNIPQIEAMIPEASFLIWLDCRKLGLSQKDLVSLFIEDARLALNDGSTFGESGIGYMRLNIGSPRSVLEKAMNNLQEAINK